MRSCDALLRITGLFALVLLGGRDGFSVTRLARFRVLEVSQEQIGVPKRGQELLLNSNQTCDWSGYWCRLYLRDDLVFIKFGEDISDQKFSGRLVRSESRTLLVGEFAQPRIRVTLCKVALRRPTYEQDDRCN